MGKKKPANLTDAEWKVMRIVWQLNSCAARDVYMLAGEQYDWAPSTVKTYLSLLVDKGYLTATRVGNSFLYRPKRTLLQSLQHTADSLLEKTLDGADGPLLAYMVKKSKLSKEQIDQLRELLDKTESRLDEETES